MTKLLIKADIRPLARPETLILQLGTLELGREYTRTLKMLHADPQLEITGLDIANPHVAARLVETGVPDPQGGYHATIEITIAKTAPWGQLTDTTLNVGARGVAVAGEAPIEKTYPVFISGRIFGDLRPEPAILSASGSISPGQPYQLSSVIYRTSGTSFAVLGATVKDGSVPGADVRIETLSPSSYRITLAGTAPRGVRALRGSVAVLTDVPGEENLTLPVSASIR